MDRISCRHCGKKCSPGRRNLCWKCSQSKVIRDKYPPASKYGNRGVLDTCKSQPLPMPTRCHPGTEAKIAVMGQRASKGLAIHHPLDRAL